MQLTRQRETVNPMSLLFIFHGHQNSVSESSFNHVQPEAGIVKTNTSRLSRYRPYGFCVYYHTR